MVTEVISFPVPKSEASSTDGLSKVFVNNPIALGIKWNKSPKAKKINAIAKTMNDLFFLDLRIIKMEKTKTVTK